MVGRRLPGRNRSPSASRHATRVTVTRGNRSSRHAVTGRAAVALSPHPALPVPRKAAHRRAMNAAMKGFTDDDLRTFADTLAKLPPPPADRRPDRSQRAWTAGKALVHQHRCNVCHLPDLAGRENVPRIAGQREDFLVKTMASTRPTYGPATTPRWAMSCSPSPTPISSISPISPPGSPRIAASLGKEGQALPLRHRLGDVLARRARRARPPSGPAARPAPSRCAARASGRGS